MRDMSHLKLGMVNLKGIKIKGTIQHKALI
jgi:hypothetical protein